MWRDAFGTNVQPATTSTTTMKWKKGFTNIFPFFSPRAAQNFNPVSCSLCRDGEKKSYHLNFSLKIFWACDIFPLYFWMFHVLTYYMIFSLPPATTATIVILWASWRSEERASQVKSNVGNFFFHQGWKYNLLRSKENV